MIVECDSCGTRFQLEDSRVPESGIRVRCSKCKKAFFLPHPSASAQAAAGEAVAPAAGHSKAKGERARSKGPAAPSEPVSSTDDDNEEADWEFNHDPVPEPDAAADLAKEPEAVKDVAEEREAAFGTVEDFGALSPEDSQSGTASGLEIEESPAPDSPDSPGTAGPTLSTMPKVADSEPDIGADLGAPEDWDFLSGRPPTPPRGSVAPASATALEPAGEFAETTAPPHSGHGTSKAKQSTAVPPARGEFVAFLSAIGWILAFGLFAVGVGRGLLPPGLWQSAEPASAEPMRLGSLQVEDVRGAWIDTVGHGRVYQITGLLHNPTRSRAAAGSALRVVLYDGDGAIMSAEPAFAGLGLSQTALRELSVSSYTLAEAQAARRFATQPLAPGASQPFTIALKDLPLKAGRFWLEAADSATLPEDEFEQPELEEQELAEQELVEQESEGPDPS